MLILDTETPKTEKTTDKTLCCLAAGLSGCKLSFRQQIMSLKCMNFHINPCLFAFALFGNVYRFAIQRLVSGVHFSHELRNKFGCDLRAEDLPSLLL
jgi:hypothetical protein